MLLRYGAYVVWGFNTGVDLLWSVGLWPKPVMRRYISSSFWSLPIREGWEGGAYWFVHQLYQLASVILPIFWNDHWTLTWPLGLAILLSWPVPVLSLLESRMVVTSLPLCARLDALRAWECLPQLAETSWFLKLLSFVYVQLRNVIHYSGNSNICTDIRKIHERIAVKNVVSIKFPIYQS